MIGMVRQLESRIVTISSVSLLLTLAKWCSLSDVYGRKLLFHIGPAGAVIYVCLNWFAASRYNILGYYVYYLEAVSFTLIPAGAVLNPAIFAYCGDTNLIVSMTSLVFHWDIDDNERYQTFTSLVMTAVLLGLLPLWNAAYKAFVVDDTDDSTQPAAHHDWIQHSPQPAPTRSLFDLEAIKMELFFSICSLFFVVVGYLLIPLFPSPTMLYFGGGLTMMGAISAVSMISLLSSVVPNQLVGAIFGAHSICQQLANVVVGLIYEPLILVMHQGQVAEYDTPRSLLSNLDSVFSSMVVETGAQNATHLCALVGL
ncbi:hypothetical protein BGZ47_001383 [Haplosporangium gracile]|nr:hypothetical protein BGZ47_001383 [Haplosporangium gracile]